MKSNSLRSTLACVLLAALPPAMAAVDAPVPAAPAAAPAPALTGAPVPAAPKPAPTPPAPPSALMVALQAVGAELQTAVGGDKSNLLIKFDRYEKLHFSAPTLDKLAKVFGDTKPATFERVPASGGARAYRFTLNPFSYTDANGSSAAWTTLLVDASVDKAGRTVHAQGQWPSFDVADKDMRGALRGMRFESTQRRGPGDLWLGPMHASISSASIEGVSTPFAVRFNDIGFDVGFSQHAKLVDVSYAYTIARIETSGQQIEGLHAASHLVNIDYAALQAFSKQKPGKDDDKLTPAQRIEQLKPLLQAMARSAAKSGSALVIDDVSARFHGHKVSMSGRFALSAVSESDLASVGGVMAKMVGHIDVRVPVALLRELAPSMLPPVPAGSAPRSPEATAQLAEATADGMVGQLLNSGYAKLDEGVLVSHIEFKDGHMTANDKVIDFGQKPQPQPNVPPVGQAPRLPPPTRESMAARAISGKCIPVPLPPEAMEKNLVLVTATAFTVGADGHARDVRLTRSSGLPDFDAAIIEAARRCEWLPALANGNPIDSVVTQNNVTRRGDSPEAGAPAPK